MEFIEKATAERAELEVYGGVLVIEKREWDALVSRFPALPPWHTFVLYNDVRILRKREED